MNRTNLFHRDKNFLISLGAEAQSYFGMYNGFTIIEVNTYTSKVPYESLFGFLAYDIVYLKAFRICNQGTVYMGYSPHANMLLIKFEE